MGNKTLADGTEIYESEFTGEQMDELLKQVKTEKELREFILSVEDGGKLTETEVNQLIADYARENNLGASDEVIRKVCQEYFAEHDITSGEDGKDGQDGVGIQDIKKTSTDGNIDTYTITLTNGSTKTFTVRNGTDGANGADGHTPTTEDVKAAVEEYLREHPVEGGSGTVTVTNPLNSMNIVTMGDSLTDTKVNGKWIAPFITLANPKSLNNYGRGNCTWTFKNDSEYNDTDTSNQSVGNNVIWNQYNRLKKDVDSGSIEVPDLIIIMAGTNDVIQGKVLGTPSNVFLSELSNDITTLTTLSQSIRYTIDAINNEYPNAKIILATPPTIAGTTSNYLSLMEVRKCIKECAGFLGLDVVDTEKAGIMYHREVANQYFLMSDCIHLTDIGGEVIANCIYDGIITTPDLISKSLYDVSNPVITIEKIGIESIEISGNDTVSESNTITLGYSFSPKNSNNYNLVWNSSNTEVATVSNGKVTGVSTGNSTITLTDTVSGVSASKDIEVTELTGTIYTVTNNLTNITTSNSDSNVAENSTYSATLTPDNGCSMESVTITMGGTDITSSSYSDGTISISSVTGNIVIVAVATANSTSSGTTFYGSKLSDVGLNDVSSELPYIIMYDSTYCAENIFNGSSEAGMYKILVFSDTTVTHTGNTSVFTQRTPKPTYELYYAKSGDTEFTKATSNTFVNEVAWKLQNIGSILYSNFDIMEYNNKTTINHAKNYKQSDYE